MVQQFLKMGASPDQAKPPSPARNKPVRPSSAPSVIMSPSKKLGKNKKQADTAGGDSYDDEKLLGEIVHSSRS